MPKPMVKVEILEDGKHNRFHESPEQAMAEVFVESYNEAMAGSRFRARLCEPDKCSAAAVADVVDAVADDANAA